MPAANRLHHLDVLCTQAFAQDALPDHAGRAKYQNLHSVCSSIALGQRTLQSPSETSRKRAATALSCAVREN
jgi:hypothetical protein